MLQETRSVSQVDLPKSRHHVRQECSYTQTLASEGEWTDTRYWAMNDQSQDLDVPIQVCHALALRGRYHVYQLHHLRLDLFHVHDLDHLLGALRLVLEEEEVRVVVAAVLLPSRVSRFQESRQLAVQK